MDRERKSRERHRVLKSSTGLDRKTSVQLARATTKGGAHRTGRLLIFVPLRRSCEIAKETMKPKQNSSAAVPILDAEAIRRALRRIAHEIIEGNSNLESLVLAGIPSRGVEIARRIAAFIREIGNTNVDSGIIDVAMHRDDVGTRKELPVVRASKLPVPLEDRTVIIVDDVLYTGRTVRAAMDAINSFGRPARIQLAVLVDRGHRELPIRPDYVGKNLPTATGEQIQVRLQETDNEPDAVWLERE